MTIHIRPTSDLASRSHPVLASGHSAMFSTLHSTLHATLHAGLLPAFIAVLFVTPLLVVNTGCGANKQSIKVEPSKPTKPKWIMQLPKGRRDIFVVGIKTRAKTLEEGSTAANQNAAGQLSNLIGTSVQVSFEARSSTDAEEYAKEELKARTAALIKGMEIEDTYHEKTTRMIGSYYEESFDVWILGKFPKSEVTKERLRQAEEQAELGRDAYKRTQESQKEVRQDNNAEALKLIVEAKRVADALPKKTVITTGGFDTVADLLRTVDKQYNKLNTQARGVKLKFDGTGVDVKNVKMALISQVSSRLTAKGYSLRKAKQKARFLLTIHSASSAPANKRVMGQHVGYITYNAQIDDLWTKNSLTGSTGETRGFGKTAEGGLNAAAKEAADKVAKAMTKELHKALVADGLIEKKTNQ